MIPDCIMVTIASVLCFLFHPTFLFNNSYPLSLAGNPINVSVACNSVAKSSLRPLGTGSILTVLSV